jgi:hypothetical protein
MDVFEDAIMRYVAVDRSTLVIPQYDIGKGWASLDFLGINLKKSIIHMIEVSSASNIEGLAKKVNDEFQPGKHIDRLRRQLRDDYGDQYDKWPVRSAVFVRRQNCETFKTRLSPGVKDQVDVFSIEDCVFPWNYWERIVGDNRSWDCPVPPKQPSP